MSQWRALPPGSALPLNESDVGGLLTFVFHEVCKPTLGNCTVQYYWPKLPAGMTTADTALNLAYILDSLGLDAAGRDTSIQAPRRVFMKFSAAYETLRYQVSVQSLPFLLSSCGLPQPIQKQIISVMDHLRVAGGCAKGRTAQEVSI